ncbi:hypothetical protein SAMN04488561_3274 [Jiangella alba]|uniref:Uncharacterized protein n=2 Tax=Jiangella alba TaxID=561176 RepID=A0A1H5MLY4_9ACTN|nr:hypothetical protein SAMN04488561_3274 [Jiangella alba]
MVMDMDTRSRAAHRRWAVAAMAWTMLYVASKVDYAVRERLGVTGGPEVGPASYDTYGPGDVAWAQGSNAGVGLLGIALLAAPLLPVSRRLPRRVLAAPLAAITLLALAGGIGMIARAITSDVGGMLFGAYCLIWAALIAMTTKQVATRTDARRKTSSTSLTKIGDPL